MIKIGVTPRFYYNMLGPKTVAGLENDTARYLASKGVMPILIPDLFDLAPFLDQLDGIVLQGGADVAPENYGEKGGRWPGDAYRDAFEKKVLDYVFTNRMPLLGICRGLQILNVYLGGTLHQDLPCHKDDEIFDRYSHAILLLPDTVLASIYPGIVKSAVNSVHHQGIKALAPSLVVEAICEQDGLIEAVSADQGRILAVQWHPEFSHMLPSKVLDPYPLIDYFIQRCLS